jgi:zona occludens toxin (predicted ATPase)
VNQLFFDLLLFLVWKPCAGWSKKRMQITAIKWGLKLLRIVNFLPCLVSKVKIMKKDGTMSNNFPSMARYFAQPSFLFTSI